MSKDNNDDSSRDSIAELVHECIVTHNELILIELLYNLEKEYREVSKLATMGEYTKSWTHQDVLNYITYHT